jgi:hypothetical protein
MKTKPAIKTALLAGLGLFVLAGMQPAMAQGKAALNPATVESGYDVMGGSGEEDWTHIVGEPIAFWLHAPFTWRLVTTPRGETVYHLKWDSAAVEGTLTGLWTGTEWVRTKAAANLTTRSMGGGMTHITCKNTFVSETGPTIEVREVYHISWDANGELRVELWKFHAWLK